MAAFTLTGFDNSNDMDGSDESWKYGALRDVTCDSRMTPRCVADLFRRADLAFYADARRDFLTQTRPRRQAGCDKMFDDRIERCFEEWFAFDCELSRCGDTPFDVAAKYWRGVKGALDVDEYRELRQLSKTNVASWFHVVDSDASIGRLWLGDCSGGIVYAVADRALSARLDGVRRGALVGRIAQSRGAWRLLGEPLYVSRREEPDRAYANFCQLLGVRRPLYADLVRLLFGSSADVHADYSMMRDYERNHGVETLWSKLRNGLE